MTSSQPTTTPEMRVDACKRCGGPIPKGRPWQEFCCDSHRYQFHNERRRKQSPPSVAADAAGEGAHQTTRIAKCSKPPRKWQRVLAAMVEGRSFNRFEAERVLNDHCLHSTVSTIQAKGLPIERHDEVVPGYQGIPTHVCRYWISDANRERALELLGMPKWHATD